MIQKTDLIILVLATAGLAAGVFRWHENTQNVSTVTIPASSTVAISATKMPAEPTATKVSMAKPTSDSNELPVDITPVIETTEAAPTLYQEFTVKSGDSLSKLAVKYNTDVSTLQQLNNIDGTVIRVGQRLTYPAQ